MNRRHMNKFAMYKAVKDYLEANGGSWSGMPAFENAYTQFIEKLSQLERYAFKQSTAVMGITDTVHQKRAEVASRTSEIAGAILAYAADEGNLELERFADVSMSKVKHTPILTGIQNVERIITAAEEYLAELEDYGVDQEKIDILKALRDELVVLTITPRKAILSRKSATQSIERVVREIDGILRRKMDKLALSLRSTAPQFYVDYQNARFVVDYGTRQNQQNTNQNDGDGDN